MTTQEWIGLKEAKQLVDDAPQAVREGLDRKALRAVLEGAGATVEVR